MSSGAQVAKLEQLLGRVQKNRRPGPGPIALGGAAKQTPVPLHAAPEPDTMELEPLDVPVRAPKPTPMEMALETFDAPEPSLDVEITFDDGPEITIDAEGDTVEETIPTAPVETRAPVVEPAAPRAPAPRVEAPRVEAPAEVPAPRAEPAPRVEAPAARAEAPLAARAIEVPAPRASGPVAHVVSRALPTEPTTFGELLDRTLALRPRS